MVVQLPVDDLLSGGGDQVTDRGVQLAKGDVRARRGLLEDAKGADHATGHGVLTDVEIDQRTGGLAAVVAVGRNLEFAHGVGFDAHLAHASLAWRAVHVPFPARGEQIMVETTIYTPESSKTKGTHPTGPVWAR